jgi:molybdate/tungstate transport system substrate-binding protein
MKTIPCILLLLSFLSASCTQDNKKLIVFHAGSLSVPIKELAAEFKKNHPEIEVLTESAGSRDCARKISELKRECDVMASADYKVISNLLIPEYANFDIRFATNQMAIAYNSHSKYQAEITTDNWPQILLREDVNFGRSDPNSDPCGYRTIMLFQLAERFFRVDGLAKKLKAKDGKKYIRPKETDLLALLEAGQLDYMFIYRSVAKQHGLKILELPDEINLRSVDKESLYATAKVKVTGKRPGQMIERRGTPIVYAVTIPKTSKNPALAIEFISLLLSEKGQKIMEENGQPPLRPAISLGHNKLPAQLKSQSTPLSDQTK